MSSHPQEVKTKVIKKPGKIRKTSKRSEATRKRKVKEVEEAVEDLAFKIRDTREKIVDLGDEKNSEYLVRGRLQKTYANAIFKYCVSDDAEGSVTCADTSDKIFEEDPTVVDPAITDADLRRKLDNNLTLGQSLQKVAGTLFKLGQNEETNRMTGEHVSKGDSSEDEDSDEDESKFSGSDASDEDFVSAMSNTSEGSFGAEETL